MEFTTRLELHSQTTRLFEGALHGAAARPDTGLSPSAASRPRGLGAGALPKHPLQITTRTPEGPDFKSELLPLHSPLLGQSLLVSFPPLIDMLKFSGYPRPIRGHNQSVRRWRPQRTPYGAGGCSVRWGPSWTPTVSRRALSGGAQQQALGLRWK